MCLQSHLCTFSLVFLSLKQRTVFIHLTLCNTNGSVFVKEMVEAFSCHLREINLPCGNFKTSEFH